MLDNFIFVYIDDIFIFSQNHEDHVGHVHLVLQRLLKNKLFVKSSKCEFHVSSVNFLGFLIEQGQLRPNPDKIQMVMDWPMPFKPQTITEVSSFANFYRRYIRNYSCIAAPLIRLAPVKLIFEWFSFAQVAFDKLKALFSSALVLIHPNPGQQFIIEVDASDSEVGAVFSQRSPTDQKIHPCAFFSPLLSPSERN